MPTRPSRQLATFDNPSPGRDYWIRHECPEFGHGAVREHIHHAEGPPGTGEHGA